jgi:hypothetical protein
MALQSNADLRLLNGLLPVISNRSGLFRGHILGVLTVEFFRGGVVSPTPNPNLEDQVSIFISPGDWVVQLYPQAPNTHFSRLLRHAWATVGLFFSPVTTETSPVTFLVPDYTRLVSWKIGRRIARRKSNLPNLGNLLLIHCCRDPAPFLSSC